MIFKNKFVRAENNKRDIKDCQTIPKTGRDLSSRGQILTTTTKSCATLCQSWKHVKSGWQMKICEVILSTRLTWTQNLKLEIAYGYIFTRVFEGYCSETGVSLSSFHFHWNVITDQFESNLYSRRR